jgi:putative hydrolase of the HAD superfamily
MVPKFLYFDLGKVLVDFDIHQMYRQIGQLAGAEPARVREVIYLDGLLRQVELGLITGRQFYEAFCDQIGARPDYDELALAASDIFELNVSIVPVVAQLQYAGHRLGILSNTSQAHWEHIVGRYRIIAEAFPVRVLSCEIHAAKPDAAIYEAAAEMAGVAPQEIFFTDDVPENVAGARDFGFDAVQYTSTPELAAELRKRGVRFNY